MALTATDLFNDATTRLIGGAGPDQVNLIVSDLIGVQQMLSAAVPQVNNLSDLHVQNIIQQLNEEIASVENANAPGGTLTLGTDLGQFVGRSINDIHRDIIDIAQGDAGVQAIFNPTPLPDLNTPAAPFHDSADQTAFITQWIQDSNHLGQAAIAIENNGFTGDVAGLVQQIQTYAANSNAFDQAQGGLWSARFWNEFRSDGTTGVAAAALVEGLQNHNAGEINAAAAQLAANSGDVGSNNRMADGGSYAAVVAAAQATAVTPNDPAGLPPAPDADAAAPAAPAAAGLTATDLYNDATTREIGGVGPDQVNLIVSDLIGVQQMLSAAVPQINNLTDLHVHNIIQQLNEEIASVENANAPAGTLTLGTDLGQFVGRSINDIHRDIIDIAQGDEGVQAIFNPTPLPDLNTPPAPFHDSADQTAFITQWIQDSNHLGQAAIAIENNGFTGDIAGLVQQIETYANNSNAFDQAQGGLWSARFWNEFRSDGTTGVAAAALIEGLQNHNAGEVNAAAEQLAANSGDVGSNNLMADGGSYAAVVAAAQATAVTPNPPTNGGGGDGGGGNGGGGNGGGGNGDGGNGGAGGGANAPAFSDLGVTFNDATRALVGGLWQNAVEEGGQGNGSIVKYTTDLTNVQTGLQAEINAGQFTGDTLTHVQTILSDITTALSAANASVNGGGTFGSVAAAEAALRTSHLDILNIVNNDPNLAAAATQNDVTGFMAAPPALADGTTAANAPHANLAEIGAIFNDLASQILGGVNADNKDVITNDVNAVITDMQDLINANPTLFGGLTGIHADTVVRQLQLENTYINQAGVSPDAGRASNDNILDIIDIVQGDTNLANMASQGGIAGFSPFPDFATPTPKYQDNDAQTNFWANFMAQSNSLGQQAIAAVSANDPQAIAALVTQLQTFQKNATDFDAAQGGIFEARFDNELLGDTSTLGAEVAAMIKGLQTGNVALVTAAADEMHANAADVSGNNIPVTGGTYNADGLTVADVLSTAGAANNPAAGATGNGGAAGATPGGTGGTPGGGTPAGSGGTTGSVPVASAGDDDDGAAGGNTGGCGHHDTSGGHSAGNALAALLQAIGTKVAAADNAGTAGNEVHVAADLNSTFAELAQQFHHHHMWG
jgi:trimeric autotransporter adhesin